jgi:hypothetical protein
MSAVTLLGKDGDIYQVGDTPPEPESQPPDPVPNLVAEYEVALIERTGPPGRILLLLEDLREPGREVFVLLHVPNRELAHLPPPSPTGNLRTLISNTNATPAVPVCEGDHRFPKL